MSSISKGRARVMPCRASSCDGLWTRSRGTCRSAEAYVPSKPQQATYPGRIVLAVDARGGFVSTEGWLSQSTTRAADLVRSFDDAPLGGVLYTDIERDGTEVGPNVAETAQLARETGRPIIASGGVGTLDHLRALAAESGQASIVAAIVGRALHEKRFTLAEAVAAAASP
jgi:phosphoribosylformimino-5-aminoimidazole carboxamide ribotide isomerase